MNVVVLDNVRKEYRVGTQTVVGLDAVSLSIEAGVFMAIAGPSGSGKSTLLNIIGCIDQASEGRVRVGDTEVTGKTPDELAALRARTIGFVFQTFNLFPVLSAEENVEYPLLHFPELTRRERKARVAELLRVVKLEQFSRRRPNELSGGQRQRVAIARALVTHPQVVLADEPTANLDHTTGGAILDLMEEINRESGTTFVFSTHDDKVVARANRLVQIEDGRITRLAVRTEGRWVAVDAGPGVAGRDTVQR